MPRPESRSPERFLKEVAMPTICKTCGEYMDGDGYQVVLHCPRADEDQVACAEPDANPIDCQETENVQANPLHQARPAPQAPACPIQS